jgi:hypothetical protein
MPQVAERLERQSGELFEDHGEHGLTSTWLSKLELLEVRKAKMFNRSGEWATE